MSHLALYRQWRPLQFEDIVEQQHIVKTLKYSIASKKISHAYLFSGTRGTGKTTMAKIFARAMNCLNPMDGNPCNVCGICLEILNGSSLDVIEMDAASNNSVDNVRDIRDEVVYTPSHAKYKVYIIDEVHMLSAGAFNALLKTLEEPPVHAVFILATTESHKLPATILSRCQRFDFKRISSPGISERLQTIASSSGVQLEDAAARLISRLSEGALRDGISLLDQCMSSGNQIITHEDILTAVGMVQTDMLEEVAAHIRQNNVVAIFSAVEELSVNGKDYRQFIGDLIRYYRNMLMVSLADGAIPLDISEEAEKKIREQAKEIPTQEIVRYIKELSLVEGNLRWDANPRIMTEIALIRLAEGKFSDSFDALEQKVEALEKKLESGQFTAKPQTASTAASVQTNVEQKEKKKEFSSPVSVKEPSRPKNDNLGHTDRQIADWEDVLKDLKNTGKVFLYTCLIGTKALDRGNVVHIRFETGGSFNKSGVMKPENLEALRAILIKRLGRDIQVRCTDAEDADEDSDSRQEDDLLKKAQEIAKNCNVPLDIIDE